MYKDLPITSRADPDYPLPEQCHSARNQSFQIENQKCALKFANTLKLMDKIYKYAKLWYSRVDFNLD